MEEVEQSQLQFEFTDCLTIDEISIQIIALTKEELSQQNLFVKYRFANLRLEYLAKERPQDLLSMYHCDVLTKHINEVEFTARLYMKLHRKEYMKMYQVEEETKKDLLRGVKVRKNMEKKLLNDTLKYYVFV